MKKTNKWKKNKESEGSWYNDSCEIILGKIQETQNKENYKIDIITSDEIGEYQITRLFETKEKAQLYINNYKNQHNEVEK